MEILITGLGAVSSVGHSAPAAAAAIRAGVTRPRPLHYVRVLDESSQATVPLTAHPIHGFTEGFVGTGRWMRLARGALRDLLVGVPLPAPDDTRAWQQTGMVVVAPHPSHTVESPPAPPDEFLAQRYLRPMIKVLQWPILARHQHVVALGHAGTAGAVQQALRWFEAGLERVFVIAADSLLEPFALQRLTTRNRLKAEDQPVGLMPGEAGACFLLESPAAAQRRGVLGAVRIASAATGSEEHPPFTGKPNTGVGLAACLQQVIASGLPSEPFNGDVFVDLNGEEWRAREWGHVLVRSQEWLHDPAGHFPATAVGDTGAASGALGLCLAVHALARGHARTRHALVSSSSDLGDVGGVLLHHKVS
ncbi:hypothetical protein [Myxococcus sp. SDU36]|uniref:hypothetical protein n=1 Tax=Myxococcus sp. SDU36 TaxID=2831967 RepID=UPI0025435052|nr:hypothetical protein [Myxococcus sp. SDU36]WIG97169.1 hypothetical protein KGD87_07180 [Myxococcus sp. SDU36]